MVWMRVWLKRIDVEFVIKDDMFRAILPKVGGCHGIPHSGLFSNGTPTYGETKIGVVNEALSYLPSHAI